MFRERLYNEFKNVVEVGIDPIINFDYHDILDAQ